MKIISLNERYKNEKMMVLLEQLDQSDLQNIARAFERIDQILGNLDKKLPSIDGPIEKARQELSNILANTGGPRGLQSFTAIWREITGRKGKAIKSIMEAQIQLVSLFRALPNIMTLAGKGIKQKLAGAPGTTIAQPGESGGNLTRETTVADAIGDPNAEKNMMNLIAKALKPAQIGSYPIKAEGVAKELMNLSVGEFSELSKRAGGANIKVPVSPEEAQEIQQKGQETGDEAEEAGGKAQQLLQMLSKDPDSEKLFKNFLSMIDGMGPKELQFIKSKLDAEVKKGAEAPGA